MLLDIINLPKRARTEHLRRKVGMATETETEVRGRETEAAHLTRAPRRSPGVTEMMTQSDEI